MENRDLHAALQLYWGIREFRPPQKQVIEYLLHGSSALVLMPTGGGKSLCYQLPALLKEGICIVVSPLIALIRDQIASLESKGIRSLALIGALSNYELERLLGNALYGNYKFLFLSPERLNQKMVLERLAELPVNFIAVDEAHCISQWGHDFRPAYRQISMLVELLPNSPVIALTATATALVQQDILENLKIGGAKVFFGPFERPLLAYQVKEIYDKHSSILKELSSSGGSAIVYVRSRQACLDTSRFLEGNGISSTYYHGGLSAKDRQDHYTEWMEDKKRVMVATTAFGMGIDKPNVRKVLHTQLPESLESYFQEAGRAGRDGEAAEATLLLDQEDIAQAKERVLHQLPDEKFIRALYGCLNSYLQIPYGEGLDVSYSFNLTEFCKKYNLPPARVLKGLEWLDRQSILSFETGIISITTLQFLPGSSEVLNYFDRNPRLQSLGQTLLRTYGGSFDRPIRIDEGLIAQKTGLTGQQVTTGLEKMEHDQIIKLKHGQNDTSLLFLVPREDSYTLAKLSKPLKENRHSRIQQLNKMIAYVQDEESCKQLFLMDYFGIKYERACGICTNCLRKNGKKHSAEESLKARIITTLRGGAKASHDLITILNIEEQQLIEELQRLIEDGIIKLSDHNVLQLVP